jgi:hypothetical protein
VTACLLAHGGCTSPTGQRCNSYFHGNPYSWFARLEEVLQAIGASYYEDTACHLDLTQWATDPTWNGLHRNIPQGGKVSAPCTSASPT